jgi:hypothetical protein
MPIEGDTGAIAKTLRAGRAGINRDLDRVGVQLVSRLRVTLSTPGQGRVYDQRFFTNRRGRVIAYGKRVPHRASAPGDPPARDTGVLAASVSAHVTRRPDGAELSVGSSLDYAVYTEFGSRFSIRRLATVAPRPWMRPTIAASYAMIRSEVADGIEGRERAMARSLGGRG